MVIPGHKEHPRAVLSVVRQSYGGGGISEIIEEEPDDIALMLIRLKKEKKARHQRLISAEQIEAN